MEIGITWLQVSGAMALALLLFCLYKGTVKVNEDQVKIVENVGGRYIRKISGIRGLRGATKSDLRDNALLRLGQLIPGEDSGSFDFIWWPLEFISGYEMRKIIRKETANLTPEEKQHILWGTEDDTEVSLMRSSRSNHYRKQFTYEMHFDGLETGREKDSEESKDKTVGNKKKNAQNVKPTINEQKNAQNVKMRVRMNITVCLENGRDAMYQEGDGGKWLTTLHSVIMSSLSEIWSCHSFTGISDLRGRKFNDIALKDGKTFLERINEQMLDVKNLGQKSIDSDFLDYEIMPESKKFLDALDNLARSEVAKETAVNEAAAKTTLLAPEINATIQLVSAKKGAIIDIRNTVDKTVIEQAKNLPRGLRMLASNLYNPHDNSITLDTNPIKIDKLSTEVMAKHAVDEMKMDEPSNKNNSNKKGGNK